MDNSLDGFALEVIENYAVGQEVDLKNMILVAASQGKTSLSISARFPRTEFLNELKAQGIVFKKLDDKLVFDWSNLVLDWGLQR